MTALQELQGRTRNMVLLHAYHTTSGWTTSRGWVINFSVA